MNKKEEIKVIKVSDDIQLKQMEPSDAPEMYSIIERERDYFGRWLPFVHYVVDSEDSNSMIVTMLNIAHLHKEYSYVILYRDEIVGFAGFRNYDEINKKAEIGYWLSQDYQKLGIVTQSVIRLMDFAYNELNINKILMKCPVGNFGSSNIPRRLGCRMEGLERAGELMPDETYIDLEIYGMLRSEFNDIILQEQII